MNITKSLSLLSVLFFLSACAAFGQKVLVYDHTTVTNHFSHNRTDCTYDEPNGTPDGGSGSLSISFGENCKNQGNAVNLSVSVIFNLPAAPIVVTSPPTPFHTSIVTTGTTNAGKIGGYINLDPHHESSKDCDSGFNTGNGAVFCDGLSPHTVGNLVAFGALVEYMYSDRDRDETYLIEVFYKLIDCTTPAPGCPTSTDLTVDHIEVVQVAQKVDNSVPLVAGKSTVVRVFVKGNAPSGLSATLKATGHSEELTLNHFDVAPGVFHDTATGDSRPERTAFNFHPPLSWTAAGDLEVEAQLRLATGATSPSKGVKVTFKDAPGWPKPFQVMYLQLCEPDTITIPSTGGPLCAGNGTPPTSLADVDHLMAKIFPIPDEGLHYFWFPSGVLLKEEDLKGDPARAAFRKLRLIDSQLLNLLGQGAPDQLVGWYPAKGVIGTQILNGLKPENSVEQSSPFGPAGIYDRALKNRVGVGRLTLLNDVTATNQDILGTTLASGIAHNLSDPIAHGYNVSNGFDGEKNRDVLYDNNDFRFDILAFTSIGHTPLWISSDSFTNLFNAYSRFAPKPSLKTDKPLLTRKELVRRAETASEFLTISGTARRDGSGGHLDAGFRRASMFTGVPSDATGNHCLRFSGDNGPLGEYCFNIEFQNVITGTDIDEDDFVVSAPWLAGTKKVALIRNQTELASLTASANLPVLQLDSPKAGEQLSSGPVTIKWTGSDADGDPLVYQLLLSTDGGTTWTPIDPEIKETQYNVDLSKLPGSSNIIFQVLVSDGLNTASSSTGPTTPGQGGPHIELPQKDLDFRSAAVGAGSVKPLVVNNTGTAQLTVTAIDKTGDAFSVTGPKVPFVIPAGEQRSVNVRFLPTDMGSYSGTLTIASSDPSQPTVTATLHGAGTVVYTSDGDITPKTLDFGTTGFNAPVVATATLKSFGPGSLRVNSVVVAGSGFSLVVPPITFYLPVNETKNIAVRFSPTHAGAHSGSLTIGTDDPVHPTLTVTLSGNGTGGGFAAPLTVSPASLDFGNVTVGDKGEQTVRVGNTGTAAVTVSGISNNPRFSIAPASLSIAAGSSQNFTVRFTPNAADTVRDQVTFAASNTSETVTVKGTGVASGAGGGTSILVTSLNLDFGTAGLDQGKDQTIKVLNTGTTPLVVTAVSSSNPNFTVTPQSFTVPPNLGSTTVTVHFAPSADGPQTGAIIFTSNDLTRPTFTVGVSGRGDSSVVNVLRTMVYHEITRFDKQVRFGNSGEPALSASGNRIVFAHAPGDETDARYSHIFVINPDGSGQREVDVYKQNCGCGAMVDISADGNTVISTDGVELRATSATGSTGRRLITNREIPYVRISPRGDRVFFVNRRGETSTADPTTERGLYVINSDGTGLRQIAGPRAVAALFGNTPDQVFPFATNGWSLDVSADGNRVVFGVNTPGGERLLAVNADGTGLKQLVGPVNYVNHAGISGDGTKVGYDVVPPPFLPNELGSINYDGSGRKVLANQVDFLTASNLRLGLTNDGSKLLYAGGNRVYNTDGSGVLQLSVRGGFFSGDDLLVDSTFGLASMNGSADRFVYSVADSAGIPQLATLDLNPASLGQAPAISSPSLTQRSISLSGVNVSNLSAAVGTGNKVMRVSAAAIKNGLFDANVNQPVMLDGGTAGDATAGDGIYTGVLAADCCAELGPRTVRVKAEVKDSSNRRHATAVEFGGLTVAAK